MSHNWLCGRRLNLAVANRKRPFLLSCWLLRAFLVVTLPAPLLFACCWCGPVCVVTANANGDSLGRGASATLSPCSLFGLLPDGDPPADVDGFSLSALPRHGGASPQADLPVVVAVNSMIESGIVMTAREIEEIASLLRFECGSKAFDAAELNIFNDEESLPFAVIRGTFTSDLTTLAMSIVSTAADFFKVVLGEDQAIVVARRILKTLGLRFKVNSALVVVGMLIFDKEVLGGSDFIIKLMDFYGARIDCKNPLTLACIKTHYRKGEMTFPTVNGFFCSGLDVRSGLCGAPTVMGLTNGPGAPAARRSLGCFDRSIICAIDGQVIFNMADYEKIVEAKLESGRVTMTFVFVKSPASRVLRRLV